MDYFSIICIFLFLTLKQDFFLQGFKTIQAIFEQSVSSGVNVFLLHDELKRISS